MSGPIQGDAPETTLDRIVDRAEASGLLVVVGEVFDTYPGQPYMTIWPTPGQPWGQHYASVRGKRTEWSFRVVYAGATPEGALDAARKGHNLFHGWRPYPEDRSASRCTVDPFSPASALGADGPDGDIRHSCSEGYHFYTTGGIR